MKLIFLCKSCLYFSKNYGTLTIFVETVILGLLPNGKTHKLDAQRGFFNMSKWASTKIVREPENLDLIMNIVLKKMTFLINY